MSLLAVIGVEDLVKIAASGGAGLGIIVGILFVKGWIVPGYLYREKAEDCANGNDGFWSP